MIQGVGEKIKPWLSSIWETMRNYPEDINFDAEKISFLAEYIGGFMDEFTKRRGRKDEQIYRY